MSTKTRALYIDTEVVFQDLELRRAGFSLLRAKLATTRSVRLLISEVVILEAINHYRRGVDRAVLAYDKAAKDLKAYLPGAKLGPSPDKSAAGSAAQEYEKRLRDTLESFEAEVVPMPDVSHRRLVERAIEKRKPFDEHGRGFNDVMIWLSLVDFLRTKKFDEVVLVTNNTKDFAKDGVVLEDLGQDLRDAQIPTIVQHCTGIHDALRMLFGTKSVPILDLERDREWQRTLINSNLGKIADRIDDSLCDYMMQTTELGDDFEIVATESAMVEPDTASIALVVRFHGAVLTKLRSTAKWDNFSTHPSKLDCRVEALVNKTTRQLVDPLAVRLIYVDEMGPATSRWRDRIET